MQLANGIYSVHSLAERETFHPVIGPAAEAEALYVKQLRLRERLEKHSGEFVIWDVGLGAAANVLTVLRATKDIPSQLRVISFDHKIEPLAFAADHSENLGYFSGYEMAVRQFIKDGKIDFVNEKQTVSWEFQLGDFPTWLAKVASGILPALEPGVPPGEKNTAGSARFENFGTAPGGRMPPSTSGETPDATFPAPHAILFDAFSPAKNPAMWTLPLFTNLFGQLDPQKPCAMPTYSRATMLRVTLLLAGFFVGVGHATGEKEETTIAANTMELIEEPLGKRWLERVRNSKSAEPMHQPVYEQRFISPDSWERLIKHPQFL